ncbi:bactofilin family protein [Hydrocarboniphaga sp.]|uniref:bactofilin family protein n=1 Tax=Hydrocarboniphaga sp. TaxID=2033016 RepID=UPI003D0CD6CB
MMFNSKNTSPSPPPPPRNTGAVETLIGRQTEIVGDLRFTGGLHLDGKVTGNVAAAADKSAHLSISENAAIEGEVRVPMIVLNGAVTGDVYASEKVTLGAKARVNGNVFYKVIEMQPGAQINGQLVHETMAAALAARQQAAAVQDYSNEHRMIDVQDVGVQEHHAEGIPD